ncbi:porin [Vibrio sp. 10N.261.55.A7]|uniref:porin n=1 Tax=Vibrio sp. 10N.261.55.A7 TaxID=1880851 RepID=UPI000C85C50E|nr:porin [Vibrio sp. 10N.261.55.A7]PMJ98715.1 hypothetical protein BCU12_04200 [Vibrio sp. 10N.261.55.A7]
MNKKLLAVAIAASAFGTQAVAVELYNNDGTTFSVGGHVSVNLNGNQGGGEEGDLNDGNTEVGTNSPRINFTATQDLGNGFEVDARGEYALNYLTNGGNAMTTRLGYVGLTHAELGRAVVGTQWAPYYDVAGVTDMPIAFANDYLYAGDDFAKTGLTRADNMVSYRNGFDFADAGALNVGVAWQGTTEGVDYAEYKDRVQATLSYQVMGASVGYAYSTGDVSNNASKGSLDIHTVSASYGSYGNGLYLAGVYTLNEDKKVMQEEITAYEVIAAYALENSLNFSINYETAESKDTVSNVKDTAGEEMALQAEYNFASNIVGYTGYQFDLKSEEGYKSDDKWVIGARFYL